MLYNYIKKREERQKVEIFSVKSKLFYQKLSKILDLIYLSVI